MKSSQKNVTAQTIDSKDIELGSLETYESPDSSTQTQPKSSSALQKLDAEPYKISSASSIIIKSLAIFKVLVAIIFVLVFLVMKMNLPYGVIQCFELILFINCIFITRWKSVLPIKIICHSLKLVTIGEIGFWVYFFCRGIFLLSKFSMGLSRETELNDRNKFFILTAVIFTINAIMPLGMSIVIHFILKKKTQKQ